MRLVCNNQHSSEEQIKFGHLADSKIELVKRAFDDAHKNWTPGDLQCDYMLRALHYIGVPDTDYAANKLLKAYALERGLTPWQDFNSLQELLWCYGCFKSIAATFMSGKDTDDLNNQAEKARNRSIYDPNQDMCVLEYFKAVEDLPVTRSATRRNMKGLLQRVRWKLRHKKVRRKKLGMEHTGMERPLYA